jgi:hypothetical protein
VAFFLGRVPAANLQEQEQLPEAGHCTTASSSSPKWGARPRRHITETTSSVARSDTRNIFLTSTGTASACTRAALLGRERGVEHRQRLLERAFVGVVDGASAADLGSDVGGGAVRNNLDLRGGGCTGECELEAGKALGSGSAKGKKA